ncbi:hypothetical protein AA309_13260 [Microvirga vignae]|uniref:Uncharacterized protein n=1 Tax=Microvirga vignae TaxID=1225564 RepID=A0A0H1RCR2_9HYPH|nr:hypothetical protein [Microvirga vignae]KLK92651.1 hypothetical protein AA309_13260 [Microvirga vignae]
MRGQQLESAWTDANWPFAAEQDLAIFLAMTREAFAADSTNSLPAFEALGYVASYYWRKDEAPESVTIPFWVVEVIVSGYQKYKASHTGPGGARLKFGEALQMEGHGQGKRPRIHDHLKQLRDIRIAIHLVLLEEKGWKIDAAIQELADRTGIHHTTVRDLWVRHAEQARKALRNFRQGETPPEQTS